MSDDFFNQPMFQLSQSNLRELERSVSPREVLSDTEVLSEPDDIFHNDSLYPENGHDQQDLKLASSQNPTVVLETDLDGKIMYLSNNWEVIVGTKVKKLVGRPLSDIIIGNDENDTKVFNNAIHQMILDDESYKVRFLTATNDLSLSLSGDGNQDQHQHQDHYSTHSSGSSDFESNSKLSNNGDFIELEAQGILIHDSKTNLPIHSIWTIKPYVPIDVDLTLPGRLIDLLGFGSEIFEDYLARLQQLEVLDEKEVPQPRLELCRICEQLFPAWFLEKHSDLCIIEHRTNDDLQICHDAISDQKEIIVQIFETLYQQSMAPSPTTNHSQLYQTTSRGSLSSVSSSATTIVDYKGIPLPNTPSSPSLPSSPNNPPGSLSSTEMVRSNSTSQSRNNKPNSSILPIKKFPFGILSRLIELCDEALSINPIEVSDDGEPKFSPNTERAINLLLSFKPFETTDPAIKLITEDTQRLINDKIDTMSRLYSILKISEKLKSEVDSLVLSTVRETVLRIGEHAARSRCNSTLNSPVDLSSPMNSNRSPMVDSGSHRNSANDNSPLNLQPPPSISSTSVTPKDILLRGRSSYKDISRGSNSISSVSSEKSRSNSKDIVIDGFNDLNLNQSLTKKSFDKSFDTSSNNSSYSYSSPKRNLSPVATAERQSFSSFQRNTPSSSPLITNNQLHHNDSLDNRLHLNVNSASTSNNSSNKGSIAKPPLSPLLVSQPASSKHSTTGSIKDYEIIKAISKGAFGAVFLAKRRLTGDYVAIKCLKKSDMIAKNQILNVKSERAVMMKQTGSPYVAQLYSSFQTNNYLYLVMEYLNGGDCATLLKMLGTLGDDWTRRYIAEVIVGVNDLHERGIIHRDLKPDNLLIDSSGHLKLTDFGLSRIGIVGRQNRLKRKSSSSEHAIDAFRKSLPFNSPGLGLDMDGNSNPNSHKRTNSVTPFSLSPSIENSKLSGSISHGSSPSTELNAIINSANAQYSAGTLSRSASIKNASVSSNRSGSFSNALDSPTLKPMLPRTSSETSISLVEDDFHLAPSQNNDVTSYTLYDPQLEDDNKELIKFVGTPDYLAPETIEGIGQSEASDWWSLGCIMFEFLFGYPPFHADNPQEVFKNILQGNIDWPPLEEDEFYEICPASAKDLIKRLLTVNPENRLGFKGADEIKLHPYFTGTNWDQLFNEVPSFIPTVEDPSSTDYFDARGADISQFPKDESSSDEERTPSISLSEADVTQGQRPKRMGSSSSTGSNEGKRERRGSRLADPSEFGSFYFRNLNILEKANKDVINRLKNEHLEHRSSFSSSSSESTPSTRTRGFSFNAGTNNTGNSTPQGGYFGSSSSATTKEGLLLLASPFKRPVSPIITANRAPSPMRDKEKDKTTTGSPHAKHERKGSYYSSGDDDIGRFSLSEEGSPGGGIKHRSSTNSLTKQVLKNNSSDLSPSSSDTDEGGKANAILRVQKRRESSRRQVVNMNELDILYCEPIPIVRHTVCKMFDKFGCCVVTVNDGDELIRRATGQVKFDLIFTALKLPKVEGIDAVKLIRHTNSVNSHTPIISITAFAKEANQSNCFDEILEKPIDLNCLRNCLDKYRNSDEAIESDGEK